MIGKKKSTLWDLRTGDPGKEKNMKKKIVYFIASYGDRTFWWNNEKEVFVLAGQKLYRTTWDDPEECMAVCRKVKKMVSVLGDDFAADVYMDSELIFA